MDPDLWTRAEVHNHGESFFFFYIYKKISRTHSFPDQIRAVGVLLATNLSNKVTIAFASQMCLLQSLFSSIHLQHFSGREPPQMQFWPCCTLARFLHNKGRSLHLGLGGLFELFHIYFSNLISHALLLKYCSQLYRSQLAELLHASLSAWINSFFFLGWSHPHILPIPPIYLIDTEPSFKVLCLNYFPSESFFDRISTPTCSSLFLVDLIMPSLGPCAQSTLCY